MKKNEVPKKPQKNAHAVVGINARYATLVALACMHLLIVRFSLLSPWLTDTTHSEKNVNNVGWLFSCSLHCRVSPLARGGVKTPEEKDGLHQTTTQQHTHEN